MKKIKYYCVSSMNSTLYLIRKLCDTSLPWTKFTPLNLFYKPALYGHLLFKDTSNLAFYLLYDSFRLARRYGVQNFERFCWILSIILCIALSGFEWPIPKLRCYLMTVLPTLSETFMVWKMVTKFIASQAEILKREKNLQLLMSTYFNLEPFAGKFWKRYAKNMTFSRLD